MKLVLAISTSTGRGSVAVAGPEGVLALRTHDVLEAHAEALFSLVDAALEGAGATRELLTAVACDVGPGSFTGVRVGVASAAGIAAALGVPGIGIGSLESMARAALRSSFGEADRVVAALDAKKGEVYLGAFDRSGRACEDARHVARERAAIELEQLARDPRTRLAGSIVEELVPSLPPGRLVRAPGVDAPCASALAVIATAWISEKRELSPLQPVYVREPDARPSAGVPAPR